MTGTQSLSGVTVISGNSAPVPWVQSRRDGCCNDERPLKEGAVLVALHRRDYPGDAAADVSPGIHWDSGPCSAFSLRQVNTHTSKFLSRIPQAYKYATNRSHLGNS